MPVSLPPSHHLYRQNLGETRSTFDRGKSLSLAAHKLSILHTYLMSIFFCLSLQKLIKCVMLDGHKFKKRAGEGERNKRIIDLQLLYRVPFFHPRAAGIQELCHVSSGKSSVIPGFICVQGAYDLKEDKSSLGEFSNRKYIKQV